MARMRRRRPSGRSGYRTELDRRREKSLLVVLAKFVAWHHRNGLLLRPLRDILDEASIAAYISHIGPSRVGSRGRGAARLSPGSTPSGHSRQGLVMVAAGITIHMFELARSTAARSSGDP